MKPPAKLFPSNRITMPRDKMENIPIYSALNKGSERFRDSDYSPFFKKRYVFPPDKKIFRLYMSGVSMCGRLLWFQLNASHILEEKPFNILHDPDNWRSAHIGDLLEDYVIRLFDLGGMPVKDRQKRLSDFHNTFSGKIDGIINVFNEDHLLEIKCLKHDKIVDLSRLGLQKSIPYYYEQMQVYLFYTELKSGYFVSLDCDNRQFYVEKVPFNETIAERVRTKIKTILTAKVIREVPEEVIVRDCFYCPAQQLCRKIDKNDFEILYEEHQNEVRTTFEKFHK